MMLPPETEALAEKVIRAYTAKGWKIVTAESCTGGLVAAALTSVSGSSAVVERGFVSYSNEAKTELLGVMPELIEAKGAVSAEVAEEMAKGALDFSQADAAVSLTGIAGPTGGTPSKPVGLVYLGLATRTGACFHMQCHFNGDRRNVRAQAVAEALNLLLSLTQNEA